MIAINRIIGILTVSAALAASGCASSYTARTLPSLSGTDTSGVTLLVNNEDGSAVLTGQVRKKIDAKTIEEYVRREYGYTIITNQITHD